RGQRALATAARRWRALDDEALFRSQITPVSGVICDEKARAGVDIVMVRMGSHPPTKAYVERRTAEGLSKPEIIRCLKRYVRRRSGARRGGSHRSVVWDRSGGRDFSSDAAV